MRFKFDQHCIGRYEDRIELTFEDSSLNKRFVISRPLRAIVGSEAEHDALKPTSPYIDPRSERGRPARRMPDSEGPVISGDPPPSLNTVKYVLPLPRAKIPKPLLDMLNGLEDVSLARQIEEVRSTFLPEALNSRTHAKRFKHLLWMEEYRTT